MQNRAFTNVTIKAVSEDRRELEGWASTPSSDRCGDEVMPEGAKFELPIPFLLDHDSQKVVGEVYRAEVSPKGIRFWARIQKITEPGAAKELVDYAWSLIKHGLRKVVSIGFRPLEYEHLSGGGLRYTLWEWYELSAVGIAAQPEALITDTKAAAGKRSVVRLAAGKSARVVRLNPVSRARISGTLKIHSTMQNRPGKPFKIRKINRADDRVVRLPRDECPWMTREKKTPVVRLTDKDRARARHRTVKL